MSVNGLKRLAQEGGTAEELSVPALRLLSAAATESVSFDDDVRVMAVRLAGGAVIHGGRAAGPERMRGARVVAALLLALRGDGVHVIGPDDETAHAEAAVAGPLLEALGVGVGVLRTQSSTEEKQAAYAADITFGAVTRFALDLLHDSRTVELRTRIGRDVPAAIVSDTGQVMIANINGRFTLSEKDRTPSGQLRRIAEFAAGLHEGADFTVNGDTGVPRISPHGRAELHDAYGVTDHTGMQALLLEKRLGEAVLARRSQQGQDYDVVGDEVVRVPSGALPDGYGFTGGLRQALEVKESVPVSDTDWLTATTTVPAYFGRYRVVGGTSVAEILFATELEEIFGLEIWDRRTPQEADVERVHATDIGRYLEINRNLVRWDALSARNRAEFHTFRESLWEPAELSTAVRHLTGEAVSAEADQLRASFQSALDQALVYYNVADAYGRSVHWPDALAEHEQGLTTIRDSLWADLRGAMIRREAPTRI
ncbi:hypothetical protein [Streptomyces sp. NPDC008139]|uniref:hypothetical protein n=1 Tax=Streptomyces sp. NPDC008139 TaxID=3364814 RepID=UPI0036E6CABC